MSENQDDVSGETASSPENGDANTNNSENVTDTAAEVQSKPSAKSKIDILLKATGNAPIMKQKKWAVEPDKKIGSIADFVKKYLKLDNSESLFLYVNQAFAPSPDNTVKNLFDCYGVDGKLVLHYCKSQAWG